MRLTPDNYYSQEANKHYLSNSQYHDFCGCYGYPGCEAQAMAKINGEWQEKPSTALLVGSYVDAYFEGTVDQFMLEHPEMFSTRGETKGQLKAIYKKADEMIARCEMDEKFMAALSGEKQIIMTGEIAAAPFKIKIDSFIPGEAIVDLKTTQSITKGHYVADLGKINFIDYWGYNMQLAAYQEVVRQNTGQTLPVFVAAVSKEEEPNIELISIRQTLLNEALETMKFNIPRILQVKAGEQEPTRCNSCNYCRRTKKLTRVIFSDEIILDV